MMDQRKPCDDFQHRLSSAKRYRDDARPYIEEALKFCVPGREHSFNTTTMKPQDVTSFYSAEDITKDLAGDLVNYFTPAESKWVSYEFLIDAPADARDGILADIQRREDKLFDIIAASNYYDIAPQWGVEAAAHGTPALWVQKAHFTQPIHFEVVPPNELFITPGHLGILDRFRCKRISAQFLKAQFADWPGVDLTDERLTRKMTSNRATMVECVWGFWLDWTDPGRPMWRYEITVYGIWVTPAEPVTLGPLEGSCPLVIGRFNPQPNTPWGRGAGWSATPDMRVADLIEEMTLSAMEQSLSLTVLYGTDGGLDLSNGIQIGTATPVGRGFQRDQLVDLSRSVDPSQGWFSKDQMEERIRRTFYQDGPRQRGETPPTASQWVDERRRVQQRLGKPSAPLWSEMVVPMIQRIEFLAMQQGLIDAAITHNSNVINLKPISPLQKAQNQDQVMVANSNLSMLQGVAGDQLGEVVDLMTTFTNIITASGDTLTVIKQQEATPATPEAA